MPRGFNHVVTPTINVNREGGFRLRRTPSITATARRDTEKLILKRQKILGSSMFMG